MRILFLLTEDLESPYGIGRYLPLAREMIRLGHQMSVAALHANFDALPRKRFEVNGVDVHYVAQMHVHKHGNVKTYYSPTRLLAVATQATLQLSRAALTIPADIIHIGKPHPMNSVAGLLGRAIKGRRVFLDCDDYEIGVSRFAGHWQREGIEFFENWMPHRADFVTTNTHFNQERIQRLGVPPEKIAYIPNGVDRARFRPPEPTRVDAARAALGLEGRRVVTFIGSLSLPGHPVDLLLKAFARVRDAQPEARLLLVGGGEEYEALQSLAQELGISDQVVFHGRVPPEEVPLYYHLADVSVDPIHDDDAARGRCPLKLFESWACGTPFVTADVGDRRHLIGDPPAGVLARPGDAESLAEAILQVLNDSAAAEAYRQRGLARVENYYWDRLVRPLNDIYSEKV